jgi:hypothetical protein
LFNFGAELQTKNQRTMDTYKLLDDFLNSLIPYKAVRYSDVAKSLNIDVETYFTLANILASYGLIKDISDDLPDYPSTGYQFIVITEKGIAFRQTTSFKSEQKIKELEVQKLKEEIKLIKRQRNTFWLSFGLSIIAVILSLIAFFR